MRNSSINSKQWFRIELHTEKLLRDLLIQKTIGLVRITVVAYLFLLFMSLSSPSHVCLSSHIRLSTHVCLSLSLHIFPCFFLSSCALSFHLSSNDDEMITRPTQLPVQKTRSLRARVRGLWPFIGWRIARFVQK